LGNKRILNNFSGLVPKTGGPPKLSIGKLVPEAFRINISVRSLFMPYRNILAEVFNGNTVQAITPTNEEQQAIDNAYAKILNAQSPGNKQVIIPGTIQQFNQSVASTA
jgi:hypothetical protein